MIHISDTTWLAPNNFILFHILAIFAVFFCAGITAVKNKFGFREFAVIASTGILTLFIGSKLLSFDSAQWSYLFNEITLPVENSKSTIGAILGLMFGLWVTAKILGKQDAVLNLFALALPIGLAIQGFACLSAGCCHGNLTSVPWGITYGPEARAFAEQVKAGMIQSDAMSSLPVHPNQIYTIIASLIIAMVVWRLRSHWKSAAGSFLFAIILYLSYRVTEGCAGYGLPPGEKMGLTTLHWKVVLLLLFTLVLIIRERITKPFSQIKQAIVIPSPQYTIKLLVLAFLSLTLSIQLADWFSPDERTIILIIVFPLIGFVLLGKLIEMLISFKHFKPGIAVMVAMVLMSQKADVPPSTPESYTSINLTSTFGKFDMTHTINERFVPSWICDNGPIWVGDHVPYRHKYAAGGIGVNRKIYYNERQSILLSLNVYGGVEEETLIDSMYSSTVPSHYKNKLWSINPSIQYDAKHIGLGLGIGFGNVAFDKNNISNAVDYDPVNEGRDFTVQTRLRLFNEKNFFVEVHGGFDAGAVGEYNWQVLGGSRFNSDKYMFKGGFAFANHSPSGFVIKGEMMLVPNLFLSPQFIVYQKNEGIPQSQNGYRSVIGLEYRFYDKEKRNSIGFN